MRYQFRKTYSDFANVHRVCKEALAISNGAKIDAVLIGGSLLGIVRDQDLLPWDKDVDFAVFEPEISKIINLEKLFRRAGFECRVHHHGVRTDEELLNGEELLFSICKLLKKQDIEHCLISGALLNLYRDGKLNRETDTLSLLIAPKDEEVTHTLTSTLSDFGDVFLNHEQNELKGLTLVTEKWRINLFNYTECEGQFGWKDLNCEYWFSEALMPTDHTESLSYSWPIPRNVTAVLRARFGDNWRKQPEPLFSKGRVPGSVQLYKDGVMVDYIFHYIRAKKTYWFEPKANVISTKGFVPYSKHNTTIGEVLIPDFPEIFLQEHYGDWLTPVKKWDGTVDNPTIIDSDVAMKKIWPVKGITN